jgi:hypothetical protein
VLSTLEKIRLEEAHFVQVPREAVLTGDFAIVPSVTAQRPFEKHVYPSGQHSVIYANLSHGY